MRDAREPAAAGMFYDDDPKRLEAGLGELFSGVKPAKACQMVVSPHAGYMYSGKTAAHAIGSLKKAKSYIIIGPNHTGLGPMFSMVGSGYWEMPLGECRIDFKLAMKLKSFRLLKEDELAHLQEHSIEVQLPFLQHRFREFSFLPVCIMAAGYSVDFMSMCSELGKTVASAVKATGAGVIASSDFSHYLPQKTAEKKDNAAIRRILKLDLPGFFRTLEEEDASICGYGPIAVAMSAAQELGLRPAMIHSSSSGDASGDYGSVVTYHAIGFY